MNKKHLVFIINPRAGVQRNKIIQDAIATTLDKDQYSYSIQYTQYAQHGVLLATQAAREGAYAVVAVGGDGSVNDIATGLRGTETALAIIPMGSGNGMARTLHIPIDTHRAIEVINRNIISYLDLGLANNHLFLSNAGVGFDAIISDKFKHSKKRGLAAYSWLVTKHLWLYKPMNWHIEIDGDTIEEKAFIVTVANGQQFGYNFRIAPDADWKDGLLDLIVIRKFPMALGPSLILKSLNGTLLNSRYVRHLRGKDIVISNPEMHLFHTDGDAHSCTSSVHFSILPQEQKVIVGI